MTDAPPSRKLLDTPISVLSNASILQLLETKKIIIDPFDADHLGPTAYRLTPHRMRFHFEDEEGLLTTPEVIRLDADHGRELRPGEYGVVSPRESISVAEGFIVDFYPSSWCVENKLVITAGRLDAGYTEDLVFGVYNAGRSPVVLTAQFQLIRATFGWLGRSNLPVYKGPPPGAYIPQMEELRKREAELDAAEDHLQRQRAQIQQAREKLFGKR
jgi:deoxycytidine triphosphate deaminase